MWFIFSPMRNRYRMNLKLYSIMRWWQPRSALASFCMCIASDSQQIHNELSYNTSQRIRWLTGDWYNSKWMLTLKVDIGHIFTAIFLVRKKTTGSLRRIHFSEGSNATLTRWERPAFHKIVVTFFRCGGQVQIQFCEIYSGFCVLKITKISWILTELFKKYNVDVFWGHSVNTNC